MLTVKNLSVRYKSTGQLVVKDISFKAKKGSTIALLGPSGCGKTTSFNVISGLITSKDADIQGSIIFSRRSYNTYTVFQEPRLLPWRTVIKNISYGLEAIGLGEKEAIERSRKAILLVGLEGFDNHYPSQISLGMQQRVNLARALVCNPDILLLDEPFSALDVDIKRTIMNQFKQIIKKDNLTSIFVTHNIDEAFYLADKIITLSKRPSSVLETLDKKDYKKMPEEAVSNLDPFGG